jgi:hypothetical protein
VEPHQEAHDKKASSPNISDHWGYALPTQPVIKACQEIDVLITSTIVNMIKTALVS